MTARLWTVPLILALATLAGLVAALTGDGWRDWIAWVALALPVVATARAWARRT